MLLEGGLKTNQKEDLLMDNEMCEDYLFQQCTESDDHCYTSSAAADPFTDHNPPQSLLISSSPHHSYHNKINNNNHNINNNNNNILSDHTNYYLSYQNNNNNNQFIQTYHKTQDVQKHQEYCDLVEQQIEQSDELNDMLYSGEDQYDYLLNDDGNNLNHFNNKYHCSSGIPNGKSNYSKNQQNRMYIQEDHKNMYLNQRESNEHQGYPYDNLNINQYWNFQPTSFHETSHLKNEQPQQIDNSVQINFNQFNYELNENVIQNQLIYQKQQTDSTPSSMQNKKIIINLKHEPNFLSGSESIQKSIENHITQNREENQIPNNNNNNYQNLKNNKNKYFGEQLNQVRLDTQILPHSHQEPNNIQLKIEYSLDQVLQSSTLPTSCNYYELLQQYEKQQAQSKDLIFFNKSHNNQEQHQIEDKINNNYDSEQQNDSTTMNQQQSSLSTVSNSSQTHKIENDFYFASKENHENQYSSSTKQSSPKNSSDHYDDIKFEHENVDEVKEEGESKAGMTDEQLLQYNLKQEFIAKSNKKNVVKNIMSAFKNFILDPVLHNYNLADLEVVLAMYNTTKKGIDDLGEMQSKFKRYITSKNFNHYTVKLLIQHQNYSNVFKYFLSGPIQSWVKNSKVSDISSHVTMIEYLKECFDDIKLIDFLKRHEKKRAHFQ